jgi:ribosome-associated protein
MKDVKKTAGKKPSPKKSAAAKPSAGKPTGTKASAAKRPALKVASSKAGTAKAAGKGVLKGAAKGAGGKGAVPKGVVAKAAAPARAGKKAPVQDDGAKVALQVAEAALDKKALQIEIIDVRGKVDYADYVVVMSGRSDRQVGAIARGIEETMKKSGTRCSSVEGVQHGNWVLMDFGDVVVHIFHEDMRGYYDLESLWMDAARVDFDSPLF